LATPIIKEWVKATDFKFGRYIYSKSEQKHVKMLEKRERGRIQGLPTFLGTLLSQEQVKLRASNFVRTLIGSIGTKAHENFLEKIAVDVVRDPDNFPGTHK